MTICSSSRRADGCRFYEPNQYILWQGEPHRLQVFVIQQGTVSLWDEAGEEARLRDVRGAGDMLGVERYNDAPNCLCSVRSESDVVVYAFPAGRLRRLRHEVPVGGAVCGGRGPRHSRLPAGGRATRTAADVSPQPGRRDAAPETCSPQTSISDAARQMLSTASDALAVVDAATAHRAAS